MEKKKLKYNIYELYCLKCHDQYPNPRYSEKKDLDLDGWIFLEINKTRYSLSNYTNIETEMICPVCKNQIKIAKIDEMREKFLDWQKDMKNGMEFETQPEWSENEK